MKNKTVVLTAFLVTATAGCSERASYGVPCTLPDEDVAAIRAMEDAHQREVLAADWETMNTSYAQDVVVMFPNAPDIQGRDALRSLQETFPPIAEYELRFEEVDGCGDLAYVKGVYSMALRAEGDAEPVTDSGRWMWILRKTTGSWVVTRDISNSDRPLADSD